MSSRRWRRPPRRRGYTLLETIISVALVGLILAAVHTVLWAGVRSHRASRDRTERDAMLASACGAVAEDLHRLALQVPGSPAVLLGARTNAAGYLLRLRTHARVGPDQRELVVDYFYKPQGAGQGVLVRRHERLDWPGQTPVLYSQDGDEARYEILAEGLSGVSIRFFDGREWVEEWDSRQVGNVPRLVEIQLEYEEGGRRVWRETAGILVGRSLLEEAAEESAP